MDKTLQTAIHQYNFDTRKPAEMAEYKALCEKLSGAGLKCFETWGGGSHYMPAIDGRTLTLETAHLFNNQWNTAPIADVSETGLRVFDWAQDYMANGLKAVKRGHWLTQTGEMKQARDNTAACGYCGKQEPLAKGYVFCPHCLDSEYLKSSELHLLRMRPVSEVTDRAPLSEAETAHLLPQYKDAQRNGSTARGTARIAKARADVANEYARTVAQAREKRDAATWILANAPGLIGQWLYYTHTGRHCFGWRDKGLDPAVAGGLIDVISEFPFPYDIKCADGRTLSGG